MRAKKNGMRGTPSHYKRIHPMNRHQSTHSERDWIDGKSNAWNIRNVMKPFSTSLGWLKGLPKRAEEGLKTALSPCYTVLLPGSFFSILGHKKYENVDSINTASRPFYHIDDSLSRNFYRSVPIVFILAFGSWSLRVSPSFLN